MVDKENNRPYARDGKPYVRDAGCGPDAVRSGKQPCRRRWSCSPLRRASPSDFWCGRCFRLPMGWLRCCGMRSAKEAAKVSRRPGSRLSYAHWEAWSSVYGLIFPKGRLRRLKRSWLRLRRRVLIASACCRLRDLLKRAGLRAGAIGDATIAASVAAIFGTPLAGIVAGVESAPDEVPDPNEYELRRSAKTVLYFSAALAALGGASASSALFGGSGGLPRLAEPAPGAFDPIWFLPCIAFGYAFALVFEGSAALFSRLSRRAGDTAFAVIAKPTAAGFIMGGIAAILPNVLFSGEVQTHELVSDWSEAGAFVLLATGVLKLAITPMYLNMGWSGGHFFPCIYSGVSCGFGIALLAGVDLTFAAGVVTTSFIACTTRKPLFSAGILLLCFPLHGMLWCGLAAVIGSLLPLPRAWHAGSDAEEEIREL